MKQHLIYKACDLLNQALIASGFPDLYADQIEALYSESECFGMIDDFESRLGLSDSVCGDVRALLVDFHSQF